MSQILSGDDFFIRQLAKGFRGYVHSTFNRTINIRLENCEELYSVAALGVDCAPNTIIVDYKSFKDDKPEIYSKVQAKNNQLILNNHIFVLNGSTTHWSCRLPVYHGKTGQLVENLSIVKNHLVRNGKSGGLKPKMKADTIFEHETARMLEERVHTLWEELITGREAEARKAVSRLIGLGPGLTPSGDDFLTGLLASFHLPECPGAIYQDFGVYVADMAKQLTNEISYMAIKKASAGEVRESIQNLFGALVGGCVTEVMDCLDKVLAIGSTSGTDIAYGVVAGMEVNLSLEVEHGCKSRH